MNKCEQCEELMKRTKNLVKELYACSGEIKDELKEALDHLESYLEEQK